MDCSVVQDKLSLYIDGVLDEGTLEEVENHLTFCEDCRAEFEELRVLLEVAGEIEEIEPPAALNAAIKSSAREALVPGCAEVLQVLSEYVDGELPESKASPVKRHLAICESCAQEMEMLSRTIAAAAAVEEVEPPLGLRDRIAALTTSVGGQKRVSRVLERIAEGMWPRTVGWAAAAAAVAAVIVGMAINQRPDMSPTVVAVKPAPQVTAETPAKATDPKAGKPVRSEIDPKYSRTAILAPEFALKESITGPAQPSQAKEQEQPARDEKSVEAEKAKEPTSVKHYTDEQPQKPEQSSDMEVIKAVAHKPLPSDNKESGPAIAQAPDKSTTQEVALAPTNTAVPSDSSPSLMKIAVAPPNPGRDMNDWAQSIKQELDAKRKSQNSSTLRLMDKKF